MTLVAGAVAGDTLESVAARVADALGCPVGIAIPGHGAPVVSPAGSLTGEAVSAIGSYADLVAGSGTESDPPGVIAEAVPVRIGDQMVGIVAATAGRASAERRAWLEAAAAAASVTALIREAPGVDAGETLVAELGPGRLVAVWGARSDQVTGIVATLRAGGMTVAISTSRRDPHRARGAARQHGVPSV